MKRGLILLSSILVLLVITGCSIGSKLKCTSSGEGNGTKINQEYIIKYQDNTVTNVEVEKSYIFNDNDKFETFGTVINHTISNMKELENDNIKFESKKSNKKYTINLEVKIDKINEEELESLGLYKKLDDIKEELENQGLICK